MKIVKGRVWSDCACDNNSLNIKKIQIIKEQGFYSCSAGLLFKNYFSGFNQVILTNVLFPSNTLHLGNCTILMKGASIDLGICSLCVPHVRVRSFTASFSIGSMYSTIFSYKKNNLVFL